MSMSLSDKRFYRDTTIKPKAGGGAIRLKHREVFLSDSLKKATEKTITDSRFNIMTALARMSMNPAPANVTTGLTQYFKTSDAADILKIKATLEKISNGINGDVTIKVSHMNAAYLEPGETKADIKNVEGYVRGGNKGDIHVTPDYVKSNAKQAVRVFIHEASHKYASTDDFDEKGYIYSDGSDFRSPGITKDQCINNADSYAYFVMMAGA